MIPDHTLPKLLTLSHVLSTLLTLSAPKPKTLYEILTAPTTTSAKGKAKPNILATLPNVTIHSRRQTPIDKEKSVGRWKVIEKELKKRGLPVTGHRADGHIVRGRHGNGRKSVDY
jgi:hypothetical protein